MKRRPSLAGRAQPVPPVAARVPWFICLAHARCFLSHLLAHAGRVPCQGVVIVRFPATRTAYRLQRGEGGALLVHDHKTGAPLLQAVRGRVVRANYRHNAPGELEWA